MGGTQVCRDHRRRGSERPSHSDYPKKILYALRLAVFHPGTIVPGEIPLTLMENTDIIAHFLKIPVLNRQKKMLFIVSVPGRGQERVMQSIPEEIMSWVLSVGTKKMVRREHLAVRSRIPAKRIIPEKIEKMSII